MGWQVVWTQGAGHTGVCRGVAGHTEQPAREAEGEVGEALTLLTIGPPSMLPALTTRHYLKVFHHILSQEEMDDIF